jgi:hypothetical protein
MIKINKWLKVTFFVLLLVGAGYFFGTVCRQIGQAYRLILSPSEELLSLLLWLLLALGAIAVIAGLVAALLRPVWVGIIAFERTVKPYEQFIPLAIAASLFMPLITISRLLAWVPTMFLSIVFPVLKALGVTKVVSETREVQRLVID